jgi:hypothetical protein
MKKLKKVLEGTKGPRVLLIACYKCRYKDESINKIIEIITEKKPDNIIVLKIVQELRISEILDANIGFSDLENFKKTIEHLKKEDVDELGVQLIKSIDKLNIPYEVHLRAGEFISDEVLKEYETINVIHLIMHSSSCGYFERLYESSAEEKVSKLIGNHKVTLLD